MTHYIGTIQLYDVMDTVQASVIVRDYDCDGEHARVVFEGSTTLRGLGEDDPREWARRACQALLRAYP